MSASLRHYLVVESDGQVRVITRKRKMEPRRHHSDNGVGLAVKFNGPPDRICRAGELRLPQSVAEDDHVIGTLAILFREELAPKGRVHLQCGKYPGGGHHRTHAFRLAVPGRRVLAGAVREHRRK